jgi:hypothetical protein
MYKLLLSVFLVSFISCGQNVNENIVNILKENNPEKLMPLVNVQLDNQYKNKDGKSFLDLANETKNKTIINMIEFGLHYNTFKELEGQWRCVGEKYLIIFEIDKTKYVLKERLQFPNSRGQHAILDDYSVFGKVKFIKGDRYVSHTYHKIGLLMTKTFEKKDGKWYVTVVDNMFKKSNIYEMVKLVVEKI